MSDLDISGPGFNIGDSVVGPPIVAASGLLGVSEWVPYPRGFDSMCRQNGPVGSFLKDRARETQQLAKSLAPIDTGLLQSSISIRYGKWDGGIYAEIYTDVYYAIFQEFGTVNHAAHPFLGPAAMAVMGDIRGVSMVNFNDQTFDVAEFSNEGRFDWDPDERVWNET